VLPLSPAATTQTVRHPRTAAGLSADGKTLILLAVDGRSYSSRGATMRELAELMKQLGAQDALNLDGGGSTTMVHREGGELKVLNTPSDGRPRPVANVLGLTLQ
jgi:exopolysaccharide biosynthesis protein